MCIRDRGEDVLTPTQDIQASPPIIQVPPNGEQLVRLVRVGKELAALEQSYRLVIDEIPDPSTPMVNGVVLRMRYSVPVFVAGATPEPAPELAWHLSRQGKEWVLRLDNSGTRYAQVALSLIHIYKHRHPMIPATGRASSRAAPSIMELSLIHI